MTDLPHVVVLEPHGAGLAIARRMTRLGARVSFVAQPGHAMHGHSRGVHTVIRPFGSDGSAWLDAVQGLAADGQEMVVLPASDRGSEILLTSGSQLPENVRTFERSGHGHLTLMDKESAEQVATQAGVRVPFTAPIHVLDDLARVSGVAPWPCVVKPIFSHLWRMRYGEARVFVVADATEAEARLTQPLSDGIGMLLCQYIPGGDDAVEEAIVVRLADGSYPVAFGCRKLRQFPPGFGATTVGESSPLTETMAMTRAILDAAGYVGIAGVEAKRHAETGEPWFLEVNVRIPGQWGLGDAAGVDATQRMIQALRGRPLPPQPPLRAGARFVVPDTDLAACRQLLRRAPRAQRPRLALKLARPYLGAKDLGLLDPRDPMPGLAWLSSIARRRLGRLGRQAGLGGRAGPG